MSAYYVPGTVLSTFLGLMYLFFTEENTDEKLEKLNKIMFLLKVM